MGRGGKQPNIAVIGAGFSGMCIAIKLREAGFDNVTIFEKANNFGGTWRENTYPGVACDVPSHLYSFSFAPKTDWSRVYSPGSEIRAYCEKVAEDYGLTQHVHFAHELVQAIYSQNEWKLAFANGAEVVADYLISCTGGLHIPNIPEFKGQQTFGGKAFHSAQWDHNFDFKGKSVAVVGTAASALQLIPEIVGDVERLDVYQRTPNWVMPRMEGAYPERTKQLFNRFPFLAKLLRLWIYLVHEMRVPLFRGNAFFKERAEKMALDHLEQQVDAPELREKLTPCYPIGCKRILASDVYYPALQEDHVSLLTEGIDQITPMGIVDKQGTLRAVDAIVYATGFKPFDVAGQMQIVGRKGQTLETFMKAGVKAHRTLTVPGFPNYFMMLGPNSGLGHNSIILIIEAQANYVVKAIKNTIRRGAASLEPKVESMEKFNNHLQNQLQDTVWSGNCQSWYQDDTGYIYTLWPRGTINFRWALAVFDAEEYIFDVK